MIYAWSIKTKKVNEDIFKYKNVFSTMNEFTVGLVPTQK